MKKGTQLICFLFFILFSINVYSANNLSISFYNNGVPYNYNDTNCILLSNTTYDGNYYYPTNVSGLQSQSGFYIDGNKFLCHFLYDRASNIFNYTSRSVAMCSIGYSAEDTNTANFILDTENLNILNVDSTISFYNFDGSVIMGESDLCFLDENFKYLGCLDISSARMRVIEPYAQNNSYSAWVFGNYNKLMSIKISDLQYQFPSFYVNVTSSPFRYINFRQVANYVTASCLNIANFSISGLKITDITANNSLPNISVNYNNSMCFSKTTNSLNIQPELNVSDSEGDTIYYYVENSYSRLPKFKSTFEDTFEEDVLNLADNFTYVPDRVKIGYQVSNPFNTTFYTECSFDNFGGFFNDIEVSKYCWTSAYCVKMLASCQKKTSIIGKFDFVGNSTLIYDITLNENNINELQRVSIWLGNSNIQLDSGLQIQLNTTSNILTLFNTNLTSSPQFYKGYIGTYRNLRILTKYNVSTNLYSYEVYLYNGTKLFNNIIDLNNYWNYGYFQYLNTSRLNKLNITNINWLILAPEDTYNNYLEIDNIYLFTDVPNFVWTTTQPSLLIYNAGTYKFNFYVSDEIHKDIPEYDTASIEFFVPYCEDLPVFTGDIIGLTNTIKDVNRAICTTGNFIGSIGENFGSSVNLNYCVLFPIIAFVMSLIIGGFIGISISGMIGSFNLSFALSGIFIGIITFFSTLIVDYSTISWLLILSGFIFAFGLLDLIRQMFFNTGGNGGVQNNGGG